MDNFDGDLGKEEKKRPTGPRVSLFPLPLSGLLMLSADLFALLLVVNC